MNESSRPPQAPDQPPFDDYHIEAAESLVERTLRTLKHGDVFAVFDQQGNLQSGPSGPDGIYYRDTRYLSHFHLKIGGCEPLQLASVLLDDNGAMVVDSTNADLHLPSGRIWLHRESIHVQRFKFLAERAACERIRVRGFGPVGRTIPLEMRFDNDFADLFEVRGDRRAGRGTMRAEIGAGDHVLYIYTGLDGAERKVRLKFDPPPLELTPNSARWELDLDAHGEQRIMVCVQCSLDGEPFPDLPPARAFRNGCKTRHARQSQRVRMTSSNAQVDAVIARAWSDLDMLVTDTPWGPYPYAGIPWYSTIFGRDGIVTALQTLWCAPYIARGVLAALAALQAQDEDPAADAQPGKIIHEVRDGEMARLGEVPFARYYGTVDATPLFVLLASRYFDRTADLDFIRAIWPNVLAALRWIDQHGDLDGDGFVEYARMTERGLANQGWKDSWDSVFHADGRLATGPIALCEVQAYVFAAKEGAARLARLLGDDATAARLAGEAEDLRRRFEDAFWLEDLGTYALALDGSKQPCAVAASNAGHALYCGIASPERARRVADLLMGNRFFTGWGIRTIATGEARYNPMSYHNGSVWPHDNALIALGFARYGLRTEVVRLFKGLLDAAIYDDLRRLPELFCGFPRRRNQAPTSYPVACSPQAWSSGTVFAMIAASSGIEVAAASGCIDFNAPALPPMLEHLDILGLRASDSTLSLRLSNRDGDVIAAVLERAGAMKIRIVK